MTELTKKISMKKTFFTTQLESFFSSITSEFSEKLNSLEVENKVLKEQNQKLDYDVKNLVEIKNSLTDSLEKANSKVASLELKLKKLTEVSNDDRNIELIKDNNKLKKTNNSLAQELENLKQKMSNLQNFIQKGANAYSKSLMDGKKEEIIKEITKNISK